MLRYWDPSRRSVLAGAAALIASGALPRLAVAQPAAGPVRLKAASVERIELGGSKPLELFQNLLPGPVLRVKRGASLAALVDNTLKAPLSVVFPGVRTADAVAGIQGFTGEAVAPTGSKDISFAPPDAGSFFYRAFDPAQMLRGLVGALIVEENEPSPFAADQALVIQSFSPDPTMKVPLLTVNGAVSPTIESPAGGRSRVRLMNASPHFLRVHVVAAAPCYVLAVDGQPTEPFVMKDGRAQITPGGRLDITVDMGTANPVVLEVETSQLPVQLAILVPVGPGTATGAPANLPAPAPLPSNGLPATIPLDNATRYQVSLGGPAELNTLPSLGTVEKGSTVVLALENPHDVPVAVQLFGTPARILDGVDDGWKPWWHDAIAVPPKATVRAALVASLPGKWPILAQRAGDGVLMAARSYQVK
ncbi:multicopper oxidase family protein [Aquabacter sp. L1I39]|uniref:multicopper oxidase family protein n=1 Tax=Aquabacter sp. L1I39 TaxID=2820278 RepID=UPI001AD9EA50|nr:multicopper oxidase family protein [Aquabacter sp. L1I39]QTL02555.1 multicopper oxidase family protein [Aquabacter sp. L1I39]